MNAVTKTRLHNPVNNKITSIHSEPCNGVIRITVTFGWLRKDGYFQVRLDKGFRTFKTEAGALRAAKTWLSEKNWSEE